MAQAKPDSARKTKPGDAAAAKQRQMDAHMQEPVARLTTAAGVEVADNHNSLRAGARGPTLLQDFLLLDKLSHFACERIPERVVGARGAGAHGWFEVTKPLGSFTCADFLQEAGQRTPVFVRFSGFCGERGSADTARDLRGFSVKFFTREGNFDLVGANFPVFFVQDAIKFPDLVHAMKPEPHTGMPQASSAHDTFWDFVSLMPETTHALMWLMSDRALPRSWRMMEGFGIHTLRLIDAHGAVHHARFQWKPRLGRHAMAADEAVKLAGRDPDFLRRDLWEAIHRGQCPEWELVVQILDERKLQAAGLDLLDPTKLVPEELVPVQPVGRMVLNRNPDNVFAETEQAAFHPGHLVPGIDVSADPLLQGRLLAYGAAHRSRLGGPNALELPINRPLAPVQTHQRDGAHRLCIARGAIAYEPHTLGNGAEFRADGGQHGYQHAAQDLGSQVQRRRSPGFDDHFSQATLFWNSQSVAEKEHLIAAFQGELSRVSVPAIRQRVVDALAHVDMRLARKVAEPLAIGAPDPRAAAGRAGFREARTPLPMESAPSLSLELAAPGPITSRKVAVLAAPGVEIGALKIIQQALQEQGALVCVVAEQLGVVSTSSGQQLKVDHSFASTCSLPFDAVLVPGGAAHAQALAGSGAAVHFVLEAYRHCKPLCLIGESECLLASLGLEAGAPAPAGVLISKGEPTQRVPLAQDFIAAIGRHRHWGRSLLEQVAA